MTSSLIKSSYCPVVSRKKILGNRVDDDNDENQIEWYDETGVDEEETGHIDDDESEMDTSQDEEQTEFVEKKL